jgi:hypothetical protein
LKPVTILAISNPRLAAMMKPVIKRNGMGKEVLKIKVNKRLSRQY